MIETDKISKGGREGREFADPLVTVLAGEVLPVVQGEEEGDLLQWCECGAGECVVGKSNDANLQDANLLVKYNFPDNIFSDLFCLV